MIGDIIFYPEFGFLRDLWRWYTFLRIFTHVYAFQHNWWYTTFLRRVQIPAWLADSCMKKRHTTFLRRVRIPVWLADSCVKERHTFYAQFGFLHDGTAHIITHNSDSCTMGRHSLLRTIWIPAWWDGTLLYAQIRGMRISYLEPCTSYPKIRFSFTHYLYGIG